MKKPIYKVAPKEVFFKLNRLNRYMSNHKGYIAGGCFKNVFNDEKVKDVDVFFEKEEDFLEAEKFYKESENYTFVYENKNVVCFIDEKTRVQIELIRKYFKKVEEMLNEFDFSIVKCAYFKEENEEGGIDYKLMYLDRFFEDLHQKKLVINDKIILPVNSFDRAFKYQRYGYGLCRESKIKLIESIRELQGEIDLNLSLYNGID
jgi:hypothetical protein